MEIPLKGTTATIGATDPVSSNHVIVKACRWCGKMHLGSGICPDVKSIKYYPDGTVKQVEFHRRWELGQ